MAKILAVDDAPETLIILKKTLEGEGHEVMTISDPETALGMAASQKFDIIFLDIMMPKIDGLEVCRRIRQGGENKTSKVVIFSAKSDRELVDLARKFGADFYLGKPAHVNKIQEVAKRMLERSQPKA